MKQYPQTASPLWSIRVAGRRCGTLGLGWALGLGLVIGSTPMKAAFLVAWSHEAKWTNVVDEARFGVSAIACGSFHTLALKESGAVLAWGAGQTADQESHYDRGQSLVPEAATEGVGAIAAGSLFSLALKTNGLIVAWGDNQYGQLDVPDGVQGHAVAISAGVRHSVALLDSGAVVVWGESRFGQVEVPAEAQTGVAAISAGFWHTMALKMNGSVVAWGLGTSENSSEMGPGRWQSVVPASAQSGVVSIAAGAYHSLALKNDGSVVGWGKNKVNEYGASDPPAETQSGVVAISSCGDHGSVAFKSDGSLVTWGTTWDLGKNGRFPSGDYGPHVLPPGNGVVALSQGIGLGGGFAVALVELAPPKLTLTSGATGLALSWPESFPQFQLKATTNLASSDWQPVAGNPSKLTGSNMLQIVPVDNTRFFRLSYP